VQILLTLAIGFAFGFVLERAGFGNARNLAAQFYLHDMRVLKVMFTAIITAMLLVFACSAVGLLDFSRVWVPPTHLGPAIVGGFVLGVGFIVGGYCPGTSLVSLSTLKIDGALFALGVIVGMVGFAASAGAVEPFWNDTGNLGRLTLYEWLRVDAGVVVVAVFLMALGAFAMAEWTEQKFRRTPHAPTITARARRLRFAAATGGLTVAVVTALMGQPTTLRKIAWQQSELEQRLADREPFIDPAELLGLMHNNQIELVMLDVRSEADYNLFHLLDARHATLSDLESDRPESIAPDAVVVTMSNDEELAVEAWQRLAVHRNVNAYVLAGGVNRWLDLYQERQPNVPLPDVPAAGNDQLRHPFDAAMGQTFMVSRPAADEHSTREFPKKVKVLKPVRSAGGGCG
jgi:rhodanese-related sulfurtransferase